MKILNQLKMDGISVVICCYNSSSRIEKTIYTILKQEISGQIPRELIIVDNNSSDNTFEIVTNLISKEQDSSFTIKLLFERNPGLINARKCALKNAHYNYLIFVDDDNHLFPKYLELAFKTMNSNSEIGILGGKGITYDSQIFPNWFVSCQENFAVGSQGKDELGLQEVKIVYGAGIIIRKDIWMKINSLGFEPLLTGRTKNCLISGEDTELCLAFKMAGFKIYYHPELLFYHDIPVNRVNWEYVKKLNYGFGKAKLIIDIYLHCLESETNPDKLIKYPLWLDKYLHLRREHRLFKKTHDTRNLEGNLDYLLYVGQKGRMRYLLQLKKRYAEYYNKVLTLKNSTQHL